MRDKIETFCEENEIEILFCDGYDDAIIGLGQSFNTYKVIYDRNKILAILENDMTDEEAIEFFEYNIIGAYVGESTPIFTVDLSYLLDQTTEQKIGQKTEKIDEKENINDKKTDVKDEKNEKPTREKE